MAVARPTCAVSTRLHGETGQASRLLYHPGMNRMLRIFRPEIAMAIKLLWVVVVTSAWILMFAWGYEGRQQARRWRDVACTYRISDLEKAAPRLGAGRDACETLDRIGLSASVRGPVDSR